nr:nucleotide-binding alpha-beta plait domain-containing protein [Tanacetum cinerariifolium]
MGISAWERYKDLLRACPHHGFTELHQLDTFYNALNPADQDSLNAAAGGNLLEKSPQDVLTIIENKSKVRNSRSKPIASPVNACDNHSSSELAKLTHAVNQQTDVCLAADGNTFPEYRDNIQGYVSAAAGNYNQGNPGYYPQGVANQMRPPGFAQPNVKNNQNRFGQPQGFNRSPTFNQEQPYQATQSNQMFHLNELEKIKRMNDVSLKAMQDMMNTASTSGSRTLPGNTIANPKGKLKAITTRSGLVTKGPTIPNPSKPINLEDSLPPHIPYPSRMLKQKQQEKEDIQIQKFWNMFKQLHLNITLTEALVLMPKYQKMLKALLSNKKKLQELANTPLNENCSAVILKKLPKKLGDPGKFLIPCGLDLVSNKQSGNPTFSLHKEIASPEVIPEFPDSKGCTFLSEEWPDIDSFNEFHPHFNDDPLSGSTTYSANSLLEEFADELSLISYPPDYDDYRVCDIESDIKEIEFLLFQGEDSNFKDSIDQSILTHLDDLFMDPTPEMFTEEQPPDYSFPPRFDVYPDDFLEIESDATFDDDSFDSEGEKIKEAELLIVPFDLPYEILLEYDSFNSHDFSRDDVLFSPDNKDKVFNPGILSLDKSVKIITHFTQEKKLAVSFASWLSEDFDPRFSELLVFKEVPNSMRLLPFSSKNEEKVFKPGIYISKKFHCCFLSEFSHLGVEIHSLSLFVIFFNRFDEGFRVFLIDGTLRLKEDDVSRISTSIYVTNFPDSFSAEDLFHSYKQYGHVVDTFIPSKRSKARKRFRFVRFINVFNVERLVYNLCTIWEKKDVRINRSGTNVPSKDVGITVTGKSYVHVVKGNNISGTMKCDSIPAIVLDDECLYSKDLSKSLLGRVKEFASLWISRRL